MNRYSTLTLVPFAALLLFVSAGLQAQTMGTGTTPSVGFAATALNNRATTNGTVFATIEFAMGGELGSWDFVIQGGPTTEFYDYGSGTCAKMTAYAAGSSCTVSVGFLPTLVGGKKGALRFKDQNGNVFGWVFVYGVGSAGIAGVTYGGEKTFSQSATVGSVGQPVTPKFGQGAPVFGIDVDYLGNVFEANGSGSIIIMQYSTPTQYTMAMAPNGSNSGSNPDVGVGRDGLGATFSLTNTSLYRNAPATAYTVAQTYTTLSTALNTAWSLAVDPQGNLWILSATNPGVQKWTWTPGTTANGGYVISTPSTAFPASPENITIDAYGNVYELDGMSNILRGAYANGTFTVTKILTNVPAAGIAVDLAGDIYIVEGGEASYSSASGPLTVYQPTSSGYTKLQLGTIGATAGIGVDRTGNVITTDGLYLYRYSITESPTTSGVAWINNPTAGTTDTTTYTVPVANVGNLPLAFTSPTSGTNPSFPAGFDFASSSTCPEETTVSATQVLNPGVWCNAVLQFVPTKPGQFSGSVVFTDNSAVAATQVVPVSGSADSGSGSTAQTITFPQPAAINFAITETETMTASSSSGLAIAYSIVSGPATVSGAVVTFTGTGTVVVEADQYGNSTYRPATSVTRSVSVKNSGIIWVLNANSTEVRVSDTGTLETSGIGTASAGSRFGGVAFDGFANAWSVSAGANVLNFAASAGGTTESFSGGGLSAPVAVAIDGADSVWVANSGSSTVSEFTNAGVAVSGTAGFATASGLNTPSSIAMDGTGGIWLTNKGANSVTHVFGAAMPVVTPLANAIGNGTAAAKP